MKPQSGQTVRSRVSPSGTVRRLGPRKELEEVGIEDTMAGKQRRCKRRGRGRHMNGSAIGGAGSSTQLGSACARSRWMPRAEPRHSTTSSRTSCAHREAALGIAAGFTQQPKKLFASYPSTAADYDRDPDARPDLDALQRLRRSNRQVDGLAAVRGLTGIGGALAGAPFAEGLGALAARGDLARRLRQLRTLRRRQGRDGCCRIGWKGWLSQWDLHRQLWLIFNAVILQQKSAPQGLYFLESRLSPPFERCDPRKLSALEPLEESTAGGGDVAQLVDNAALREGGDRVPATGDAEQPLGTREVRHVARDRDRAALEGRRLEGAHGSVPDQSPADVELRIDRGHGARADVEDHRVLGHALDRDGLRRGVCLEFSRHHRIDGQQYLAAGRCRRRKDAARGLGHVVLGERPADLDTAR